MKTIFLVTSTLLFLGVNGQSTTNHREDRSLESGAEILVEMQKLQDNMNKLQEIILNRAQHDESAEQCQHRPQAANGHSLIAPGEETLQ